MILDNAQKLSSAQTNDQDAATTFNITFAWANNNNDNNNFEFENCIKHCNDDY